MRERTTSGQPAWCSHDSHNRFAPGKINHPEAAGVNSVGHVHVINLKNDRVWVCAQDGKFSKTRGKTSYGTW